MARKAKHGALFSLFAIALSGCATLDTVMKPVKGAVRPIGMWFDSKDAAPEKPKVPAAPKAAQEPIELIAPPRWQSGEWWRYSDGYGLEVDRTEGDVTFFERTDVDGQWFSRLGFLRDKAVSRTSEREVIFRSRQAGPGDSLNPKKALAFRREYLSNGVLKVHATSWKVEGRKQITVPAGTFDTWVIVWRTRNLATNWSGFERWYYAPKAKNYVRLEYRYGSMPTLSRVLMDYHVEKAREPLTADDKVHPRIKPRQVSHLD